MEKEIKSEFEFTSEAEVKNFGDLKKLLDGFTDEQLQLPIRMWGDEYATKITSVATMLCDFINPSGEGCEPLGYYEQYKEGDPEYMDVSDEPIVLRKGAIVLQGVDMEDFKLRERKEHVVRGDFKWDHENNRAMFVKNDKGKWKIAAFGSEDMFK